MLTFTDGFFAHTLERNRTTSEKKNMKMQKHKFIQFYANIQSTAHPSKDLLIHKNIPKPNSSIFSK